MILLLGANGYIGSEFASQLYRRNLRSIIWHRSPGYDYRSRAAFKRTLEEEKPKVVINCAAFVKDGAVDNCEDWKYETLTSDLALPVMLAEECQQAGVSLLHVSTGCLFNGDNGGKGWSETDEPELSFKTQCGIYVGSKELAERLIRTYEKHYICRIRLPFDQYDWHRNYLSKLMRYPKAVKAINSLSHRGDFVSACLDLLKIGAPFGTYNVTNPGGVDSEWICQILAKRFNREFVFWDNEEFLKTVARTPKSNCVLNVDKLLSTGVTMRNGLTAVHDAILNWVPETEI